MITTKIILFTTILCTILCTISADNIPVLMWTNYQTANPVKSISTLSVRTEENFQKQISQLTNDFQTKIIVLNVDTLRTEHFKNKLGNNLAYENVAQIPNKIYDPAVSNPIQSLRRLNQSTVDVSVQTNNELTKSIENGKIVFIDFPFNVGAESREQYDGRADRFADLLNEQYQGNKYLFILTGKSSGDDKILKRKPRATGATQSPATKRITQKDPNLLISIKSITIHKKNEPTTVELTSATTSDVESNHLTANLKAGDLNIVMYFNSSAGSWYISGVTIDELQTVPSKLIGGHLGGSFHCSPDIYYKIIEKHDIDSISIQGLQVQPKFKDEVNSLDKFGFANDCVGFTSAGIWAGLFVSFLLIFILTVGLSWIMDIRTMDRFDDPKGKTITVNASD